MKVHVTLDSNLEDSVYLCHLPSVLPSMALCGTPPQPTEVALMEPFRAILTSSPAVTPSNANKTNILSRKKKLTISADYISLNWYW